MKVTIEIEIPDHDTYTPRVPAGWRLERQKENRRDEYERMAEAWRRRMEELEKLRQSGGLFWV